MSEPAPSPVLTRPGWDWGLVAIVGGLCIAGLLAILSASSAFADQNFRDPLYFVRRQGFGLVAGAVLAAWIVSMKRGDFRRRAAWPLWVTSVLLMAAVWTPIGRSVNGAQRWIDLGPLNFQPSELAKVAVVLMLAHFLAANEGRLRDVVGVALPGLAFAFIPLLLAVSQKDFGAVVLIIGLAAVLLVLAGLHLRWLAVLAVFAGLGLVALILDEPYRAARITNFATPFAHAKEGGYQIVQGWIALATGGLTGAGVGGGVAQRGFLPEAHTDMIAAVVGEEMGAIGLAALVGGMILLALRTFRIARASKDLYGVLVAAGLGSLFAAQAIINLGVVGALLPAKGLVLPFFSYGASAAMVHVASIGILLRIDRQSREAFDVPR